MDIVPILPGQPHSSILHILSEGSIQLLCGGRCHPTDSSDVCGSIIVVTQYNIYYRCYSKVDGGIKADMESASHIPVEVCISVNGLPEHAMKFSPSHYMYCVLPA